jgi:hypothetical protein
VSEISAPPLKPPGPASARVELRPISELQPGTEGLGFTSRGSPDELQALQHAIDKGGSGRLVTAVARASRAAIVRTIDGVRRTVPSQAAHAFDVVREQPLEPDATRVELDEYDGAPADWEGA